MPALAEAFVRIRADTSGVRRDVEQGVDKARVDQIGDKAGRRLGDAFSKAMASGAGKQIRQIADQVAQVARQATVRVEADTAGARAELADTLSQVQRLDGATAEVEVNADTDRATRGITRLGDAVRSGASSAFSRLSAIARTAFDETSQSAVRLGTSVTTSMVGSAAAAGSMTAATGGLNIAVGVAAAAALTAVAAFAALTVGLVALAPIVLTVGGLVGATATALVGGGAAAAVFGLGLFGIGDAMKAMSAAQKDAAGTGASLAAQENAIKAASDGVRQALAAQGNTRANVAEGARRASQRLIDAQKDLTFAERDALAVRRELSRAQLEARRALEDLASQVSGNALDQRQATLDVAEAQQELNRVNADPRASALQRQQAQLAYERAVAQVEDLRRRGGRLRQDQAAANKAGVEGSEQVRAARGRISAADQRVAESRRALDEAQRARDEQRRQGTYQLAQATQAVAAAQRSLQQASTSAGNAGSAAATKLNDAMAALSPNARALVKEFDRLRGPFGELRKFVQDRLLDGVAGQVRALSERWLPALRPMLGGLADQFNTFGDRVFAALGRTDFIDNIRTAVSGFGGVVDRIGKSMPGFIDAFGRLAGASTPVLQEIGNLIGGILDKFSRWIKAADQSGALDQFMRDAAQALRDIFHIGGQVIGIVGEIIEIFFPASKKASGSFLGGVEERLRKIREWLADPENQQKVRDWVAQIQAFVSKVVNEWIPKAQEWITKIAGWVDTASMWINRAKAWGAAIGAALTVARVIMLGAWTIIREKVFGPLRTFITQTIPNAFTAGKDKVAGAFRAVRDALSAAWGFIRDRIFGPIRTAITQTIPNAFKAGVGAIGKAWKGLESAAKVPVKFVVDTVINKGIIDTFNKVAGVFPGVGKIPKVPLKGFDRGGVLPGYTPGRDPHIFRSATGGTLALSGGEAVLRPEATRALGRGWVDEINATARSGGVGGVRGMLGQYADGGIIGMLKAAGKKAAGVLGGAKDAITDPGGTVRRIGSQLLALVPGAASAFGKLVTAPPRKLVGAAASKLDSLFGGVGRGVGRVGGGWPSSPSAQRGDSGVWRQVMALVKASGIPYSFGNAYRHGDPLWHGSGRAVDLMGYNQDRLAQFFMNMRPRILELIHTTNRGGYYITRGQRQASMGVQDELHRNHLHVAMKLGGLLAKLPCGSYDTGGYLPKGLSLAYNGTGAPEAVGGAGGTYHFHFHGPVGSQRELDNWVVRTMDRLKRERRLA